MRATARNDYRNDKPRRKIKRLSPVDRDPTVRIAGESDPRGKQVPRTRQDCRDKARSPRPGSEQKFPWATRRARGKNSTKNRQRVWRREQSGWRRLRVAATRWRRSSQARQRMRAHRRREGCSTPEKWKRLLCRRDSPNAFVAPAISHLAL